MRRADRLFRIVQMLRSGRLKTARSLAERLQVSERTIYRDVRDLQLAGQPIEGEAGVGYTLRREFDLPPLLFTPEVAPGLGGDLGSVTNPLKPKGLNGAQNLCRCGWNPRAFKSKSHPLWKATCYLPTGETCNIASSVPVGALLVPILSWLSVFETAKCR